MEKYNCEACVRYTVSPAWGHTQCTSHRACSHKTTEWKPEKCQTCMMNIDRLELMTDEARSTNISEMRQMLNRTQTSKAIKNINWQYEQTLDEYIRFYEPSIPIETDETSHSSPENREEIYTPISETRLIRENRRTPISRPGSSNGSVAQLSVQYAMNHKLRKTIDKNINAEETNIRIAADRGHSSQQETLPRFQLVHSNRLSRKDQFENSKRGYLVHQDAQRTPQYIYVNSNDASRRKRPRQVSNDNYEETDDHYVSEMVYDEDYDNYQNYESPNRENETNPEQHASGLTDCDDYYGDYQNDPSHSDNEISSGAIPSQKLVMFDEFSNLPWFKVTDTYQRVDDRRMMVPTASGQKCIEVNFHPSDPTWFQAKSNATKSKVAPFMGGIEAYNILLKAYEDISPSDTISPNKSIRLIDSEIKPNSYMNDLLQFFKTHNGTLATAAAKENRKDMINALSDTAFESTVNINFTQGWCLGEGEQFKDWVKDKQLSVEEFTNQISSLEKITVDGSLLNRERKTRSLVAAQLTSIHLAELSSRKIANVDNKTKTKYKLSSEEHKAQARLLLDVLRSLVTDWMQAKMKIRRSLVADTSLEPVVWLQKSNLWSHNIFPKEAVDYIKVHYGANNNVKAALGINKPSSSTHRNTQQPPYKKIRLDNQGHVQFDFNRNQNQNRNLNQNRHRGGHNTRGSRRPNSNRRGGGRGFVRDNINISNNKPQQQNHNSNNNHNLSSNNNNNFNNNNRSNNNRSRNFKGGKRGR